MDTTHPVTFRLTSRQLFVMSLSPCREVRILPLDNGGARISTSQAVAELIAADAEFDVSEGRIGPEDRCTVDAAIGRIRDAARAAAYKARARRSSAAPVRVACQNAFTNGIRHAI